MTPEEERAVRAIIDSDTQAIASCVAEIEAYVKQVCARLERDTELRPRFVEARRKDLPDIIRKMDDHQASPEDVYKVVRDIVGARVVVYNLSDAAEFRDEVLNDSGCPLSDLECEEIDYPTGYRAKHLNGALDSFGVEIQVRTAVQDAWAVTSRADVYPAGLDNPLVASLSAAQSAVLSGVDLVLQEIRDLSEKSRVQGETAEDVGFPDEDAGSPPSREGLDDARMRQAREALSTDDRFVLDSRISDSRVAELKKAVENQREGSLVRQLLKAVGRYERQPRYDADVRFGNRLLAWKGPLVEGSSWAQFHPDDFSRGLEGFLQKQLGKVLERDLVSEPMLESWHEIDGFVADAINAIRNAGGHPDLVIVQGNVQEDLRIEMFSNSGWIPNPQVRDRALTEGRALEETIGGLPTLWIYEDLRPALHVVDLTAVEYVQTNPDAMSEDDLYVEVESIKWETAVDLLNDIPDLATSLYGSSHSGAEGSFNREEAVVHLQLQVKLNVIEAGRIQYVGEPSLVRSVALKPQGPR